MHASKTPPVPQTAKPPRRTAAADLCHQMAGGKPAGNLQHRYLADLQRQADGSVPVRRLMGLQAMASVSTSTLQRVGDPPYKKEITLQTNYVTLGLRNPKSRVAADDVDDYVVMNFSSKGKSRPPVWLDRVKATTQGQHKVAWVAIWNALQQCVGYNLSTADMILSEIITNSQVPMIDDGPMIQATMGHRTPPKADTLIAKAHNYLASRQRDNPSWPAEGTEEEKKAQLDGKGERALVKELAHWQGFDTAGPASDATDFFTGGRMELLFDTTDRDEEERRDVAQIASRELKIHNPEAFAAYETQAMEWVSARANVDMEDE